MFSDAAIRLLEGISHLATIIGIPIAITIFVLEKRKHRKQLELEAFMEADERYRNHLMLCLQYPELNGFDPCCFGESAKNCDLDAKNLTMLALVVSMLESSFVLYRGHEEQLRSKQWQGWRLYMVDWARRPEFRKAWPVIRCSQFDTEFIECMDQIMKEVGVASAKESNSTISITLQPQSTSPKKPCP